jgi:hypothetical protein
MHSLADVVGSNTCGLAIHGQPAVVVITALLLLLLLYRAA